MANTAGAPYLLWLCTPYSAVSGMLGIAPFVMALSYILRLQGPILAFVIAAALSHVFSLAGAGQLAFRNKLAVLALVRVFVLGLGGLLAMGKSTLNLGAIAQILWLLSAAALFYAITLVKRGMLT